MASLSDPVVINFIEVDFEPKEWEIETGGWGSGEAIMRPTKPAQSPSVRVTRRDGHVQTFRMKRLGQDGGGRVYVHYLNKAVILVNVVSIHD